jgi:octaprenyl-diphosphate synthase
MKTSIANAALTGKSCTPVLKRYKTRASMNLKVYAPEDFPSYLPKLNALYDDLFSNGKGFRAKLIQKISHHLQLKSTQVHLLAQTIEFIHNASLLHDDLIDRSELRREKTAAWLKYTPEYAVLAGDYLLARVMVNLSLNGNLQLIQYTAEMISDLLEGEWIQDSLIEDWDVSLNQLDRVHNLKTASLFKWCMRAPFIAAENYSEKLHKYLDEMGSLLGLLFQRSDDLLDFDIRNNEGKAILGDLKSGYMNSFATFLTRELSEQKKAKFREAQSMGDVYAVIGEAEFFKHLEDFDQHNKKVLSLFEHHCIALRDELKPSELGLLDELRVLPGILYWRKV